jgi:protein-L-isoaspartate(D-aspartate) O-methyltransferase
MLGQVVTAPPVLFTVEFRRKMAQLSQEERLDWLSSLAARVGEAGGEEDARVLGFPELREVARACRLGLVEEVQRHVGAVDGALLAALLEVPRERFVRRADIAHSAEDTPLPLDDVGLATISAPHAYVLSFRLLKLNEGDGLVELGTGSGYGAALASFVVGPSGQVRTFEIDPRLAGWARGNLAGDRNVRVIEGDAITSAPLWGGATKVVATFAVDTIPPSWLEALPEGGVLVAPVGSTGAEAGPERDQRLVLATKLGGAVVLSDHGAVRYVKNRSR